PDRRRMLYADRWKLRLRAFDRDDGNLTHACVEDSHVHRTGVAPQPEQSPLAGRQLADDEAPAAFVHHQSRPWAMSFDSPALDQADQRCHEPTRAALPRSGTMIPVPAACRRPRRKPAQDARTSADTMPWLRRSRRAARRTRWY